MTCGPSETKIVGIGKRKNKLIKMLASKPCDWLLLPLLLPTLRSSFHCITLKERKKRNVSDSDFIGILVHWNEYQTRDTPNSKARKWGHVSNKTQTNKPEWRTIFLTCGPSETKIVGIGKRKNKLIKMLASKPCDWLLLPLLLPTLRSSFHCITLKERKKRNVSDSDFIELMAPLTTRLRLGLLR